MRVVELDNPRNYKEAGDQLLDKLNLNNIQLAGLNHFMRNVIPRVLSKTVETERYRIRFKKWYLDDSKLLPEITCKSLGKTREVELRVVAEIDLLRKNNKGEEIIESTTSTEFLLDKIPLLSEMGSLIINGNEINMVSHLSKPDGLYYESRNTTKDGKSYLKLSNTSQDSFIIKELGNGDSSVTLIKGNAEFGSKYRGRRETENFPLSNLLITMDCDKKEIRDIINTAPNSINPVASQSLTSKQEKMLREIYFTEAERSRFNMQLSLKYRIAGKKLSEPLTYYSITQKQDITLVKGTDLSADILDDISRSGVNSVKVESAVGPINVITNNFVRIEDYVQKEYIPNEFIFYDTNIITKAIEKRYYSVNYEELKKILEENENKNLLKLNLSINSEKLIGRVLGNSDIKAMVNLYSVNNIGVFPLEDVDSLSVKTIYSIASVFEILLKQRVNGREYGLVRSMTEILKDAKRGGNKSKGKYNWSKLNLMENNSIPEKIVRSPLNSLFQRSSNINPIDESSQRRKVSLTQVDSLGGVNADYSTSMARNVHPSQFGRLCPIESPEGKKVGLILHLATSAMINAFGLIEAPFFKVDGPNRKIDFTKAYYLTYEEERYHKKAFAPNIAYKDFAEVVLFKDGIEVYREELDLLINEVGNRREVSNRSVLEELAKNIFDSHSEADHYKLTIGLKNWFTDEYVDSIDQNGRLIKIRADEVELLACRGDHMLSATSANIPFAEYNDGTRLLMGCAMSKQAEPAMGSTIPLITTQLSEKMGREIDGVVKSPIDGIITSVSTEAIEITPISETEKPVWVKMQNYRISSEGTSICNRVIVNKGDVVVKGDILADMDATKNGELAASCNLNVAYTVYDGYNYEDGIVISDRLLKEDVLTSFRITEIEVPFDSTDENILTHPQYLSKNNPDKFIDYTRDMDPESKYGLLKKGTRIKKGGIVFIKYIKNLNGDKYQPKVEVNNESAGILINTLVTGDNKNIKTIKFHILTEESIKVGDKLSGRYGNKGCIAKIVPQALMPYTADGTPMDILLTPLGVPSRMNIGQLIESQLGAILNDLNIRAEVESGMKIDIPKIKMLTNMYTGDKDGKVQLYDGRTGKPFAQKANVGVTGIYKLKHLTTHKAASRGSGGSSGYLPNGQPVKGRSRNGGQVIAEMELWAFMADNATDNLREIQVFKSDDPNSRARYSQYLEKRGDLTDTANFTQSYKKMASFLTAMGLKMEHLDMDGNEVDIYNDEYTIAENKYNNKKKNNKSVKTKEELTQKEAVKENLDVTSELMGLAGFDFDLESYKQVDENKNTPKKEFDINEKFDFTSAVEHMEDELSKEDWAFTEDKSEDSMDMMDDGSETTTDEEQEDKDKSLLDLTDELNASNEDIMKELKNLGLKPDWYKEEFGDNPITEDDEDNEDVDLDEKLLDAIDMGYDIDDESQEDGVVGNNNESEELDEDYEDDEDYSYDDDYLDDDKYSYYANKYDSENEI